MITPSSQFKKAWRQTPPTLPLHKVRKFQDEFCTDEQFLKSKKSRWEKFQPSLPGIIHDSLQKQFEDLRLPSITTQRKHPFEIERQRSRKLLRAKSCEALFYNYDMAQNVKQEKRNFNRINFVRKSKKTLQNQPEIAISKKSAGEYERKSTSRSKEGFRKKQRKISIQISACGSVRSNLIDRLKEKDLTKKICSNCQNQKIKNQKIKACLTSVTKMIEQFKQEFQNIRSYFKQLNKTLTESFNTSSLIGSSTQDQQDHIFMTERFKTFVEELSEDISDLFEKQLKKMEGRKRSDIGKIIKNTVPKFERADFLQQNLLTSSIKKKQDTCQQIFSSYPAIQGEQQQFPINLQKDISNKRKTDCSGKIEEENNLTWMNSYFT